MPRLRVTVIERPQSSWNAPIGIPDPGWGVLTPTMPALPSPWSSDTSDFYYVKTGGTNANQGYPASPRGSIPAPIPAGAVVVIDKSVTFAFPARIQSSGTLGSPSFLVGSGLSKTDLAVCTAGVDGGLDGSYLVIEFIKWNFTSHASLCEISLDGNVDHLSIRHCEAEGINGGVDNSTPDHTPFQLYSWNASYNIDTVIFYDDWIHNMNMWNYTVGDRDVHGIQIGCSGETKNVWILDSTFDHICGDSMQVGPQSPNWANCHHVYMGRCTSSYGRQSGGWAKGARDVIFSQNTVFAYGVPGGGGSGIGLGLQQGTDRCWFLFNHLYNLTAAHGIAILYNTLAGGEGVEHYAIGNVIHDFDSSLQGSQNGFYISAQVTGRIYLLNNTIYGAANGVNWHNGCPIEIWNNIFDKISAHHLTFDSGALPAGSTVKCNLLGTDDLDCNVVYSSTHTSIAAWQADMAEATNNLNALVTYESVSGDDYRLAVGSRGIDEGNPVASAAYARFTTLYGLNIELDFNNVARPQNSVWDIGAYER